MYLIGKGKVMIDSNLQWLKALNIERKRWPLYKLQGLPSHRFLEVVGNILKKQDIVFLSDTKKKLGVR